jgi:hypothetical protein
VYQTELKLIPLLYTEVALLTWLGYKPRRTLWLWGSLPIQYITTQHLQLVTSSLQLRQLHLQAIHQLIRYQLALVVLAMAMLTTALLYVILYV